MKIYIQKHGDILVFLQKNRKHSGLIVQGKFIPSFKDAVSILLTFSLTVFAWIFFRAENIGHAFQIISEILSYSLFEIPEYTGIGLVIPTTILTIIFVLIEWFGREGQYAIAQLGMQWPAPLRYAMYYAIIFVIFWFGGKEQQFIYFQF